MASDWEEVPFNDLGEVGRGKSKHRPRYAEHLYGGKYPFIQTGDIRSSNGRITEHTQTYSEEGLAQSKLWPKGTMCITIAANIAETAILTYPACFPDSVVGFIANEDKCDVRFAEYSFRLLKRRLQSEAVGSVQDNINLATLSRLSIKIPPLPEQKTIAHILGTLDDKIELNRQMNDTLEAMAQTLFKSWFVDFDPVIDNALAAGNVIPDEFIERAEQRKGIEKKEYSEIQKLFPDEFEFTEEMGWIPKGWEVGSLDNMFELQRGFDLPKTKRTDGFYPLMAASGQDGTHDEYKVKGPGVITGRSGKLGIVSFVNADYWPLNTTLWVKNYNQSNPYHAYFFLQTLDLEKYNSGSAVPSLNRNNVHNLIQILPSNIVLDKFQEVIESSFAKIAENNTGIETLAKLRDTLLPNLMSGEIRIPDAAAFVENI